MTRKDFELIAGSLNSVRQLPLEKVHAEFLDAVCFQLAKDLKVTNSQFDRERFLTACGVEA